jgi:mono/diheme cytochrome c family protein
MRSFRRALTAAAGVAGLVVATGIAGVSAQNEWKAPPEAKNLKNPQPPTPTSIANGKKLAEANCVSCHGPKGKGDGPATAALPPPKPADWTAPRVKTETDGELFWKISDGRGAMPPFKHLPERDRWDLVNYIRSLQK